MKDLALIIPSRGRPESVKPVVESALGNSVGKTKVIFGLDNDDDSDYKVTEGVELFVSARRGMCGTLNRIAISAAEDFRCLGFMGDDHRPRTPRWDERIIAALEELGTGIAYGNDLLMGEALPTAVFMTSDIVRALGYMAPPELHHLYLDNFWLDLGTELGKIKYLDDLIIEHMHPTAGKAEWDDGYRRVNTAETYSQDEQAYLQYKAERFEDDVRKIRESTATT